MAIKSDFSAAGDNRETVNAIVNKLSGMLETYEQVSAQYENQLKQFLMARKASKLDTQSNEELEKLKIEYEKFEMTCTMKLKKMINLKINWTFWKMKFHVKTETFPKREWNPAYTHGTKKLKC